MPPYFDSPNGPEFTLEDLNDCGWKVVLEERDGDSYPSRWAALERAVRQTDWERESTRGKALRFLMHVSSMMLKPEDRNGPLQPSIVFIDGRSAMPEDFTEQEMQLLEEFIDSVDDLWLKARIADILWLRRSPRDPKFALDAIDTYTSIPLNGETWAEGAMDCWKRAISLSLMLQQAAGDRLTKIEGDVLSLLFSATKEQRFFALKLAQVLEEYNLASDNTVPVSERLRTIAEELQEEGSYSSARSYFANAAVWFRRAGDDAESARMTVNEAETHVREAEGNLASEIPSNLLASTSYEKAFQTYRNVPRAHRESHQVDQRTSELRDRLNEAGLLALDEMTSIESPTIDLTPFVNEALEGVKGKTTQEAMLALSNLFRFTASEMREAAMNSLAETPLRALIASSLVTHDGRTVARNPGYSFQSGQEENEAAIEAEMIRFHYEPLVNVAVMGKIIPALNAIALEHQIAEGDFIQLARVSPIVPPGRDRLYGKALYHGYNRDFASALHLLAPQIEHLVRHQLKVNGVTTTSLDRAGIETENGLSTLVELPEVKHIFGDDLTFELKALFCSPFGANLRNEVAHGLVEDEKCLSPHSVYAWWLGLKLAFNTWWNLQRNEDNAAGQE